jgi:hypothetical protein
MKAERVAKLVLHVVLAGTLAVFGITAIIVCTPADWGMGLAGLLMVLGAVVYFAWVTRPVLPKRLSITITGMGGFLWNCVRVLSKIALVASAVALVLLGLIWMLDGLHIFLTAPIGFKPEQPPGALESSAKALWLPAIGVFVISAIMWGWAKEMLEGIAAHSE